MKKEFENMEFTGERFVPEVHGNIELEHLHRYRLAMQVAVGKTVLDIASGEGFGSAMLARVATSVTGVDISDEAVSHSRAKYQTNNLNFLVGSCSAIPLEDATVDVVVSFETIEHHTEHDAMMSEIKRVLRPGGVLVISSPDKLEYSDRPNFSNPHHVKELYRDEFKKLLDVHFKNYSIYGQRVIYGSAIFCEDRVTSLESYELADPDLSAIPGMARAVYLIAIASDGELPLLDSGVLEQPVNESEVLHPWSQAIAERDGQIVNLSQAVAERDSPIASLQKSYDNLARRTNDLDLLLKQTLNSRSWRITYPLRTSADLIRTALQNLRTVVSSVRQKPKRDAHSFDVQSTSDAAAMAIARTGRHPSETYLAAIEPIALALITPTQRLAAPKYSIVILQFNQSQLTINCLNSILRNTPLEELEIIVVDNGSSKDSVDALAPYKHLVKVFEVGVNRYYGEGNNLGVELATGEFIILMNNDIAVTDGWLEKTFAELQQGVGAVGPCFLYPDDMVQEAGGYVAADGSAEQRYKREDISVLPTKSFECDYVSGALLLMRRSDFFAIGGLDLCWEPAYYEDVDLCLKLRLLGLKTLCCPAAKVYHVENATSSDKSLNLGLENIVEVNKAKFVDRWGPYLSGNIPKKAAVKSGPPPVSMVMGDEIELRNNRPRALIYTPFAMTPGGGERYILSIAAALGEMYDVTIAFTYPYSTIRLKQLGEYFGLDLSKIKSCTLDKAFGETKIWDLAFVLGNSLCPPFPAPSPKSFYICQFPFDHKQLRGKHLPLSDEYAYICYSKFVSSFVARALHSGSAKGIHVFHPPVKIFSGLNQKNKKIISIGRFFVGGHCKNQHLLIEAFKNLSNQNPDLLTGWELVLAGSTRPEPEHRKYFSDCQAQARGYPIRILPDASSEVLARELTDASIYWHGAGIGINGDDTPERVEHFGITPLEAASAGCLVVVHNSGGTGELAEQFPECIFSYTTIENLQQLSLQLMQRTPENSFSLREATKAAAENYSYANFEFNLFKLIN